MSIKQVLISLIAMLLIGFPVGKILHIIYDKDINLYDLTLKFNFTHFIVYMYYTAVPMHI